MTMKFGKAAKQRLALAAVPRESGQVDRLLDNSRQMLRLDLIDSNPRNPRAHVDDESLHELAASIAEHGLLQAPVVRRHPENPDRYMVVLGARRVAAHRLLGREEIEVIVRRLDDQQAFLASCVENVQRVELSPREEMDMIGVLIDELGSQEAVARALGKSPTWLTKRKRVLAVPALAAAVERAEISLDHAYDVLTRAPDEDTALAQVARIRAGLQTQGQTRSTSAPRGRTRSRGTEPTDAAVSDRNSSVADQGRADRPEGSSGTEVEGAAVSARNSPVAPQWLPGWPEEASAAPQGPVEADGGDAAMVVLEDLQTVRLLRLGRATATRDAVLSALHADLQALGGSAALADAVAPRVGE